MVEWLKSNHLYNRKTSNKLLPFQRQPRISLREPPTRRRATRPTRAGPGARGARGARAGAVPGRPGLRFALGAPAAGAAGAAPAEARGCGLGEPLAGDAEPPCDADGDPGGTAKREGARDPFFFLCVFSFLFLLCHGVFLWISKVAVLWLLINPVGKRAPAMDTF